MRHSRFAAAGCFLILFFAAAPAAVQAYPYYYGPASGGYRTAPAWASPNAAALGPWAWNFNFGGGPTAVAGNTDNTLENGYNFTVGTGYNFSPRTGFVFEFMNSGFDLTDQTLRSHNAVDGDASVWAVTLNPIWRFRIAGPVGGYIIGGGGFYQREERFREPGTVFFHNGFSEQGLEDVHEFDNTGGVNAGVGLTWNVGWGTKFYVEARYHYVFTAGTPTQLVPVTFGFRW
jgi:hypothetical protein